MAQYVYLLADYDDEGSKNVVASLDRSALPGLLERHFCQPFVELDWSRFATEEHKEQQRSKYADLLVDYRSGLARLLQKTDPELAVPHPWNLARNRGWGGVQLLVAELSS